MYAGVQEPLLSLVKKTRIQHMQRWKMQSRTKNKAGDGFSVLVKANSDLEKQHQC